jgi:hypothetical protein
MCFLSTFTSFYLNTFVCPPGDARKLFENERKNTECPLTPVDGGESPLVVDELREFRESEFVLSDARVKRLHKVNTNVVCLVVNRLQLLDYHLTLTTTVFLVWKGVFQSVIK